MSDDPIVTDEKIPSYELVESKIRQIDNTIIIMRTFYILDTLSYRFQLIRKDRMCIVEIPKKLLDDIKHDGAGAEEELSNILSRTIESRDCWTGFEK